MEETTAEPRTEETSEISRLAAELLRECELNRELVERVMAMLGEERAVTSELHKGISELRQELERMFEARR